MSKKLGDKFRDAVGNIGVYLVVGAALVLICVCAGGCVGTIIDGFNSLMTGVIGR